MNQNESSIDISHQQENFNELLDSNVSDSKYKKNNNDVPQLPRLESLFQYKQTPQQSNRFLQQNNIKTFVQQSDIIKTNTVQQPSQINQLVQNQDNMVLSQFNIQQNMATQNQDIQNYLQQLVQNKFKEEPEKQTKSEQTQNQKIEYKEIESDIKQIICVHHKQILNKYCETCEDPVCELCSQYGPHNDKYHKIEKISKLTIDRFNQLQNLQPDLQQKKLQYKKMIQEFGNKIKEINKYAEKIYFDSMNEFTSSHYDIQLQPILQFDLYEFQKQLYQINDICNFNQKCNQLQFLQTYDQLRKDIYTHIQNKIEVRGSLDEINIQELEEKILIKNKRKYQVYNDFQNQLITSIVMQINDFKHSPLKKIINVDAIQSWIELANKTLENISDFILICDFCGYLMTKQTLNNKCYGRPKQDRVLNDMELKLNSKQRHFFIKSQKPPRDHSKMFYDFIHNQTALMLKKLDFYIIANKCKTVKDEIALIDKDNKGYLNSIQFKYFLEENDMTDDECEFLTNNFIKDGQINIDEVLNFDLKQLTIDLELQK